MLLNVSVPAGKYIVAVSGGVDSVVLLDILAKQPNVELVVAHVDHGIRADSSADARFVRALAEQYGLEYRQTALNLGAGASEDQARRGRYAFLQTCQNATNAAGVVTAHHAGDVVETVVLNIMRGTGWRGLASLRSKAGILRPLLHVFKSDILHYALDHRLEWVEDETNAGLDYTRNLIRHQVVPLAVKKDAEFNSKMLRLYDKQVSLREKTEPLILELLASMQDSGWLSKAAYFRLGPVLQREILRAFLLSHRVSQTRPQLLRIQEFLSRAKNRKRFSLDAMHFLEVQREHLVVITTEN